MTEIHGDTVGYAVRMLWFALLVSFDVSFTATILGGVTPGMRQALVIKSCVLFGVCVLVMAVEFPSRENTGEEQETA